MRMEELIGKKFIVEKTFVLDNTIFYSNVLYELVDYEENDVYNLFLLSDGEETKIFGEQPPVYFFKDWFSTQDENRVKLINTVLYT